MLTVLSDTIRRARRQHICDQCCCRIRFGDSYRRQVYVDGDLCTYRAHKDCDDAAARYANLAGLHPNWDDLPNLRDDLTSEDYCWLLDEFPTVADRFGIQGPPHVKS